MFVDYALLKEKVKIYAPSIGVDKIGFTDAGPLTEHLPRLLHRQKAEYRHTIKEGDPNKRITPCLHMPHARSVISIAVAYPGREGQIPPEDRGQRGRFSFISRGLDYHQVVKGRLEKLRDFILSIVPRARILMMVDKDEILEKAIAVRAGLGWFGRHNLLVTPEFGSWVCLGEIVTDIPFPADEVTGFGCGSCRRCIEACPTGALKKEQDLNLDRCLASVTLSKFLPEEEIRKLMGNTLYGCDVCQTVCPYNRRIMPESYPERFSDREPVTHPEFAGDPEEVYPVLHEVLQLTNKDFRKRFGHLSGAWRGRTPVQKNAAIAAGNLRAREAVPELIRILLSDSRPVLRGAAAWALGRIGTREGTEALNKALRIESDPDVQEEIKHSLGFKGKT